VQRRPIAGLHHSVERYFRDVRAQLPADINASVRVAPYVSSGVLARLITIADTALVRGDVVHITGDIQFAALARRRANTVLTVLDCGFLDNASPRARAVYERAWMRWPARHAARIVAISAFTADQVAQYARVPRESIDVIDISVDDAFVPAPPASHVGPPVVLCFAKTPNKNFARSIEALRGLDVQLHVVNNMTPENEADLVENGLSYTNSAELDDDAMHAAYEQADLVLFPSTYEGFGMPIVEAQATGRPVVTSNRSPMTGTAGEGACLVDPEDAASIRAGVEHVLADATYRAELIRKGLENRERFRPQRAAEAYARLYREVAG